MLLKKLKNLAVFGDCNHPFIDWEFNNCKKGEDHCNSQFLFEITRLNYITQLIVENTHFKPNCKATLIDLLLTKSPEIISHIKHNPPIGKSFHQVLTVKFNVTSVNPTFKNKNKEKIIKPNFDKANYLAINDYLSKIEWSQALIDKDVNEAWKFIKEKIHFAHCTYVPNKIINPNKIRTNPVTMDDTLHFLLKNKRYYFKQYKKYRTTTNFILYNQARNNVSKKIRLMKKSKENKIAKKY